MSEIKTIFQRWLVVDYKVSAVDYKVLKLKNYIPGMDCSRLQGCVVDYKVLKFKTYIPERNRSRLQVICSRLQRARNACNGYKRLDFEINHS